MITIAWIKYSATIDTFEIHGYLLKRIRVFDVIVFEILKSDEIVYKTSDYLGFLKKVQDIIEGKFSNR